MPVRLQKFYWLHTFILALRDYQPKRLNVPTAVLYADDCNSLPPDRGYSEFVSGQLAVVPIHASHLELFDSRVLAPVLPIILGR